MQVSYFLTYRANHASLPPQTLPEGALTEVARIVEAAPALAGAVLHTPSQTSDPYLRDAPGAALVAQLYFDDIDVLETQLAPGGYLQALADPGTLPWLRDMALSQQAMLARRFAVPAPGAVGNVRCTYLVAYDGAPRDYSAWHTHYVTHHVPLMTQLPHIREVEVCTRLAWASALAAARDDAVQRNKVVFDTPDALTQALQSPVRHEMRRDFLASPPFDGASRHEPMASLIVQPVRPATRIA